MATSRALWYTYYPVVGLYVDVVPYGLCLLQKDRGWVLYYGASQHQFLWRENT